MINFEKSTMNKLEVVGELVDMQLEERLSSTGKNMIIGNVDVEVKKGNAVNVIELKVLCMASSKLFSATHTVMTEYKTRKLDGVGDKVEINGSIDFNEYVGRDGSYHCGNVCNAKFFHRLKETEYAQIGDKAELTIGGVYMGSSDVLDSEGLPTDEHEIELFGRTWNKNSRQNDKISCLQGLRMKNDLFEFFDGQFTQGENLVLEVEVNRGAEVQEIETKGFGKQPVIQYTSYKWDYQIVGGSSLGDNEPDDIEELMRLRNEQKAEVTGDGTQTEGKSFGKSFGTQKKETSNDNSNDLGFTPDDEGLPF